MPCSVTYSCNVSISTLVSDTASLVRTVLTASLRNAGQLILVNYEGQVMSTLLLLVNSFSVARCRSTVYQLLLSQLLRQQHANLYCSSYCCRSTAVSFTVAGQLPSHLLLQVNCCFCCYCWSTAV
jgi:hypothetical protein